MMEYKKTRQYALMFIVFIFMIVIVTSSRLIQLLTDYLWLKSVGYTQLFLIELKAKILLFVLGTLAFFVFSLINIGISTSLNKSEKKLVPFKIKLFIIAIVSFLIGGNASLKWLDVLKYFNQVAFNLTDPIFMKDVAFYVFSLPFFNAVLQFTFMTVGITLIMVALDYLQSMIQNIFAPQYDVNKEIPQYSFDFSNLKLKKKPTIHITILGSFIFLLLAVRHFLSRFSIMYSEKGIVVGAGYSDVMVSLPIFKILMIFALAVTVFLYIWLFISKRSQIKKRHFILILIGIYLVFGLIGPSLIPEVFQSLIVSPNEINLEKPYIENNIKFTNIAYGLSNILETDFPVEGNLDSDIIDSAEETIDNIRILDRRPLRETYKQTQEIRLYYDLSGIDVDRYYIDGKYTSVLLAARELDQKQITDNAKTWVNLRTVYTHGYGVVMSPVNSVTKEGLPNYLIQDIPPTYTVDEENIKITRPQIYYGELDHGYVLVNTKTNEFDYPKGNTNEYTNYEGKGGIVLDSFLKKLLMAIRFGDIKILLSTDVTPESKVMINRFIRQRVARITAFLIQDNDPYLVINDGKLYWIIDGYTFTGNFPYSEKYKGINYIRNPVKITIDAYDGDVNYYVVDESDPMLQTYAKIFPGVFKPLDELPEGLKEHLRYPKDMFNIQAEIYSTYHMNDATVFYNKEDAWQIPSEIYGTGQQTKVEPYHIIMKLPDEEKEEFILMTTFNPIKKNNMVAWLAARSDGENYGKLLSFKFPKDKLIYGPLQIEAKFDQDSEISQQLTLWSQQGSRVTRGNLLIIPLENNILYVEPLYIQAETGQLPELKRILVSDGERVVMEENLQLSLEALFGKKITITEEQTGDETADELIVQASEYYDLILEAMRENDWTSLGENFDKLGEVLNQLNLGNNS